MWSRRRRLLDPETRPGLGHPVMTTSRRKLSWPRRCGVCDPATLRRRPANKRCGGGGDPARQRPGRSLNLRILHRRCHGRARVCQFILFNIAKLACKQLGKISELLTSGVSSFWPLISSIDSRIVTPLMPCHLGAL
jgi:hypothetical protein